MSAIGTQELKALRNNRNRWQIKPEDLDNWAPAQRLPIEQHPSDVRLGAHADLAAVQVKIAQLEERLEERAAIISAAEDRTSAAERERDRWRDMAERLASFAADLPLRRRWWPW